MLGSNAQQRVWSLLASEPPGPRWEVPSGDSLLPRELAVRGETLFLVGPAFLPVSWARRSGTTGSRACLTDLYHELPGEMGDGGHGTAAAAILDGPVAEALAQNLPQAERYLDDLG